MPISIKEGTIFIFKKGVFLKVKGCGSSNLCMSDISGLHGAAKVIALKYLKQNPRI